MLLLMNSGQPANAPAGRKLRDDGPWGLFFDRRRSLKGFRPHGPCRRRRDAGGHRGRTRAGGDSRGRCRSRTREGGLSFALTVPLKSAHRPLRKRLARGMGWFARKVIAQTGPPLASTPGWLRAASWWTIAPAPPGRGPP